MTEKLQDQSLASVASVDWLSMTFHDKRLQFAASVAGNGNNEQIRWLWAVGSYRPGVSCLGYDLVFRDDFGTVFMMSQKREDMGTHVVLSGATLDALENSLQLTPVKILSWSLDKGAVIKRLDAALDVKESGLKVGTFAGYVEKGRFLSRAKSGRRVYELTGHGDTVYLGSRSSLRMLRVYDKAAEQRLEIDWLRFELESKGAAAMRACRALYGSESPERVLGWLVRDFVQFPDCAEWEKITGTFLGVTKPELSHETNTDLWLYNIVARSLARRVFESGTSVLENFLSCVKGSYDEYQIKSGREQAEIQRTLERLER